MTSLLDLLYRQVSASPDAPAVVSSERTLTFRELDEESTRVAATLATCGIGSGDLIGLLVERDLKTIVRLVAILKLGAAYVPLDPDHPAERTRFVVQDAALVGVIGAPSTAERAGLLGDRFIDLSSPTLNTSLPFPLPRLEPSTTAYVMYTSGSTGRPKGCVITHGNVLAFIESARSRFAFCSDDRWALVASHCFDASVWELWGALAGGAVLVIVPLKTLLSPREFVAFLADERITVLTQIPSAFRYTVDAFVCSERSLALRHLFLGGERVDLDVVRTFLEHLGTEQPTVVNVYGPTETTVFVTTRVLDDAVLSSEVGSPIGHPLAHAGAHVIGPEGSPVPVGEVGELWVSGASLASGYLNRQDLTRERFVKHPQGPASRALRYYRTGDRVRQLVDGGLEYIGRDDGQVKVRGYRIELDEIDVVLRTHPAVVDAAACVVGTAKGPSIRACVVCVGPLTDDLIDSIRAEVKSVLPVYMVPHRFVKVAQVPLTTSQKLDRVEVARLCSEAALGSPR